VQKDWHVAWSYSVTDPREKFVGDFDRNEVEIDLSKFMDLLKENNDLKERIRDLESDASINPWQKWVHFAKTLDSWRIFPRAFISVYMFLLYYTTIWFMELENPTLEQSGLISVIVGAGAAWFGLYTRSKGDGDEK
jgi:hypothetical protein